jgi:CNT family concentrative nucleoside transporter
MCRPLQFAWRHGMVVVEKVVPEGRRTIAGSTVVFIALFLGVFIPGETQYNKRSDRAVSVFGYLVFLFGLYATSRHRKHINGKPVIVGILVQFIMAFFVLQTTLGKTIFKFISDSLTTLLTFAYQGVVFLTDSSVLKLGKSFFIEKHGKRSSRQSLNRSLEQKEIFYLPKVQDGSLSTASPSSSFSWLWSKWPTT